MSRGLQDGDIQPREVQLGALSVGLGVVELPGGELGRHGQILGAEVNLAARVRRQLPDSAYMVKVPVGQQDRFQRQPQLAELVQNGVGLIARVDDAAEGTFFVVDDVAVDLIGPQSQGVHFQHRYLLIFSVCPSAGRCPESGSPGRR